MEWAQALGFFLGSIVLARIMFMLVQACVQAVGGQDRHQVGRRVRGPGGGAGGDGHRDLGILAGLRPPSLWENVDHLHGARVPNFDRHRRDLARRRLLDSVVSNVILHLDERTDGSMAVAQFGPILQKTLRALVWILGIISGLTNAGYDVGALLAGVGIGGLAMAMAAKDFVANIFGGVTVFIDKPFTVGDRIKVNGIDGTVQEIGIRSTRLSTLENRMVTIPNHQFTDQMVENVTPSLHER